MNVWMFIFIFIILSFTSSLADNQTVFLVWKENFKNKTLSDDEIIDIMIKYPKLIERPIVINGNKGIVGRPTEKILEIL